VGLVIPSLSDAAVGSLAPARFGTGSAVFNMSRRLGAVFGVAIGPRPSRAVEVEPLAHGDRLPRLEPLEQRSGL
jgi:hypothetical protein